MPFMGQFNILRFTEVESTNSYALKNLHSLADRQVIVAERQTGGYGRLGRRWVSHNPDNIYMSLILKYADAHEIPTALTGLTQYMSVTLCELLLEYGVSASIKWPNDVRVGGAKIAGLLGEASFQGDRLMGYVLGCGVNLNIHEKDLASIDQRATSLNLLLGAAVERDRFLDRLLERFFTGYEGFLEGGFPTIRPTYEEKCDFLGKQVVVKSVDGEYRGTAKSFTERGELVLERAGGEQHILRSGDLETMRFV
jgi:BirA family biotin operon repressor/biotin-[acetyl-CoA-carboxylase] ligase